MQDIDIVLRIDNDSRHRADVDFAGELQKASGGVGDAVLSGARKLHRTTTPATMQRIMATPSGLTFIGSYSVLSTL